MTPPPAKTRAPPQRGIRAGEDAIDGRLFMDRETRDMLLETADRFFTERCGRAVVNEVEKGVWPADLWKEIEEMGLPLIAVPEERNGAGGTLADMLALLRLAGSHALPV